MNTRPSHPQAEPYLRSPQRGGGHTPGPAPQPFGSLRGLRGAAKLANTPHGRLILACVVTSALTITLFLGNDFGKTGTDDPFITAFAQPDLRQLPPIPGIDAASGCSTASTNDLANARCRPFRPNWHR